MEWKDVIAYIVSPLLTLILILFNLYLNARLGRFVTVEKVQKMLDDECEKGVGQMEKKFVEVNVKTEKMAKEVMEIKTNYLDRFDEIKTIINDKHEETLTGLGDIKSAVASQAAVCKLIQEQKKR